jgi:hypothetical protein
MTDDPLAQFRKTKPVPPGDMMTPKDQNGYIAFGTKDRVVRLRVRPAMAPVQSPGYNILLNVSYDGDIGTNFVLMYTVMDVLVRGKNLQKMIYAIENGMADFIQEFDSDRWEMPSDPTAAIIDSIEVRFTGGGSSSRETQH